jgi:hypothetical protein
MDLFAALDGFRFWYRGGIFVLRVGRYSNGRPAIVYEGGGETVKISVNLPEEEIAADEFFVKWAGDQGVLARADMHVIVGLGLFEETSRRVSTGFVDDYAAAWGFKLCWWTKHAAKDSPRVVCPDCRADFEKRVAKHEEERDAREALGRLETLSKIERGQTPTSRAFGRFGISSLKTPRKR